MTTIQQTSTNSDDRNGSFASQAHHPAVERDHGTHPYAVPHEPAIVTTLLAVTQDDPKGKGFTFKGAGEFKRLEQPGTAYVFRLVEGLCEDEAILSFVRKDSIDVAFMMAGTRLSREHKAQTYGLCTLGIDLWSAYVAVDYRKVQMVAMTRAAYAEQVYNATIRSTVPEVVQGCIDFDALGKQMHNAGEIHAFRWFGEDFVITNPQDFRR